MQILAKSKCVCHERVGGGEQKTRAKLEHEPKQNNCMSARGWNSKHMIPLLRELDMCT